MNDSSEDEIIRSKIINYKGIKLKKKKENLIYNKKLANKLNQNRKKILEKSILDLHSKENDDDDEQTDTEQLDCIDNENTTIENVKYSQYMNENLESESESDIDILDRFDLTEDESSSSDNEDSDKVLNMEELLYENSNTSLYEFLMAFNTIKLKNKLNDFVSNQLLKFIRIILPSKNKCPKSLKKFENNLFNNHSAKFHRICSSCKNQSQPLIFKDFLNIRTFCPTCSIELSSFATFDLDSQLQVLLKQDNKIDQIIKSYDEAKRNLNSTVLKTPLDGSIYKNYLKENSNHIPISLVLNGDGAPLTNSKNFKLWPLTATVLELNQSSREKFENIIYLGILICVSFVCIIGM